MRIRKFAAAAAIALAALGLSGCASGLNTQVSRYQPAAIPAGASFYVVPLHGNSTPGFYRYASMVSQQLAAQGFKPAGTPQLADVLVRVDYGVDQGKTEYVRDYGPSYGYGPYGYRMGGFGYGWRDPFYDPFWGVYYGRPYWSRWGRDPFYYGWDDPFWYGGGRGINSYVEYHSELDLHIRAAGSGQPLFDGRAQARSQSDRLDVVVPSLVEAMFSGFPGRSGETVKITIPTRPKS